MTILYKAPLSRKRRPRLLQATRLQRHLHVTIPRLRHTIGHFFCLKKMKTNNRVQLGHEGRRRHFLCGVNCVRKSVRLPLTSIRLRIASIHRTLTEWTRFSKGHDDIFFLGRDIELGTKSRAVNFFQKWASDNGRVMTDGR